MNEDKQFNDKEKNDKKRTVQKILLLLIILFIVFFPFIRFNYITNIKLTDISEYTNIVNNYKVLFQAIGEPQWPFGPHNVQVTLFDDNGNKIETVKSEVSNDGGVAHGGNISVTWGYNLVHIYLKGDEAWDDTIVIKYEE